MTSDPDDLWFHLEGYPSGHCILEVNQKESKENSINYDIDTVDIIFAANLVKSYSKLKNHNKKLFLFKVVRRVKLCLLIT